MNRRKEPLRCSRNAPSTIPRADVADVLVAALDSDRHRETIKIATGPTPIEEAVKS